uniref:lipoamide acyltransferase component of branched-chain alpha-keto acid dehydrogenase complex, mitochondrial-like n=1 Tax=Styela clava TaxID=7725 RepID=UPI00193A99A2|nr:lipoamide acyltransferase component of branched-chain alpha-keto acid dehydrogenase complex, mitochondrial-like [Styela clava]
MIKSRIFARRFFHTARCKKVDFLRKSCNVRTLQQCSQIKSKILFVRHFHNSRNSWMPVVSFNLSDIGEGIKEVELTEWFVQEGDEVAQFDSICEVKSDKASVTITSRFDGVIKKLHHEVDDIVLVGQALVDIETSGSLDDDNQDEEEVSEEVIVDRDDEENINLTTKKALASPAVRSLAKKNSLDISTIQGSGPDGRVLKEDILNLIKGSDSKPAHKPTISPPVPVSASIPAEDKIEPIKGIRKVMLVNMTEANKIPHFGYNDEYDLSNLVSVRKDLKHEAKKHDIKLSYLPFILKAVSMSLSQYPILNSSISDDMENIIYKSSHNIGIAVDSPHGLLLPCIKDVQNKSILEVAHEVIRLQNAGLDNKLHPNDLSGGTFSISNIGSIGGTYAHPVIFPPQVAIGALGKIQVLPRYDREGDLKKAHIMCVSWSADHRIIEGATMSRFSNNIKYLLEDPSRMVFYLK